MISRFQVLRAGRPAARFRRVGGAIALLFVLWLLETVLLHAVLTAEYPSANDFFPRWLGARARLLAGLDPYSAEVTRQIQVGMFGRPAGPGEDQVAFAYPLFVIFPILPLIWLPYAWAQAAWQALLLNLIFATVLVILAGPGLRRLAPIPLALLALATVLFYPAARALILGQFAVVVVAALSLALWAQRRGQDRLVGAALAVGLLKPQLVFLILPGWLIWAAGRRRWGVWVGFGLTAGSLLVASLVVQPNWPVEFVRGLIAYQEYTRAEYGSRPVLAILLDRLPAGLAVALFWIAGLAGVLGSLALWWRVGDPAPLIEPLGWFSFLRAYLVAAVVTLIFPFDQPTTNQLVLLPLLVVAVVRAPAWAGALGVLVGLIAPWAVFLLTREGRVESAWQYLIVLAPGSLVAWLATRRRRLPAEG